MSLISGNKQVQDFLRTDLQIFNPIVNFLLKASESINLNKVFGERTVNTLVQVLIAAVDTNK